MYISFPKQIIRIDEGDIIEVDIYLNVSSKVLQSLF